MAVHHPAGPEVHQAEVRVLQAQRAEASHLVVVHPEVVVNHQVAAEVHREEVSQVEVKVLVVDLQRVEVSHPVVVHPEVEVNHPAVVEVHLAEVSREEAKVQVAAEVHPVVVHPGAEVNLLVALSLAADQVEVRVHLVQKVEASLAVVLSPEVNLAANLHLAEAVAADVNF